MCLRLDAFFMPKVSSRGAGYAQTIVNSMVLEQFHVLEIWCVFLFLGLFWASFLLILGVLGRHFGSQKVDANFDRKTGMELNPGIPRNPGTEGPNPLRTINKTSLGQQGPRRHSTSWLRHGGGYI